MELSWTYSNVKPKIQRLQGVILFPVEISLEKTDEGKDQYKYKLVRVKDTGQTVTQDRTKFISENKHLMSDYFYGSDAIGKIITGEIATLNAEAALKITEEEKPPESVVIIKKILP